VTGDRPLEYRVLARNTSASSENKIHDDTVAKRYGFGGGLVPGITVYAYLTRPLVEAFGRDWLERGTAAVKFVKPIFEGDAVLVTARVTGREGDGLALALSATTPNGGECAVGTATLPDRAPAAVDPARYPEAALPDDRPDVSREHLASVGVLGSPVVRYDTAAAAEYIDKVSDDLPAYRGGGAPAHPGFLLQQCNRALSGNVRLGPWIHTGSRVQHLGGARVGDVLSTRGRVHGFSEKKGRESVELDLLIVANGSRPVAQVFHSAIYRLPAPAEA
jgi:acyl dehydratase